MQWRLWPGEGEGEGRGGRLGEGLGAGRDGVGSADTVSIGRGVACGAADGAPAAGGQLTWREVCGRVTGRPVSGAADRPATGAAGPCGCGAVATYTAVEATAAAAVAVAQATQCARSTRAARRNQDWLPASSSATEGAGTSAARQPARREARSATRTAARCRRGSRASDTYTFRSSPGPR
jgi:hypothetical protein